jgi:hypothetical protein
VTTFVAMYHSSIPSTATDPVEVALSSVDDHAARGWLLVDPDAVLPDPVTPYYTKAALLSQITGGAAPIGTALRAAYASAAIVPRSQTKAVGQGELVINVADYGADLTGATDSAAAVQSAIDAANAAGGGVVLIPRGTARIKSGLTLYSNVTLQGVGRNASIIKAWDASNIDLITSYQFATLTGGNTSGGVFMAAVRDLTLDGNKTNNPTSGYGLRFYGAMFEMSNVVVRECRNDGIYTEWSNSATVTDGCESYLRNVVTHHNGGWGINWGGSHDSMWTTCISFQNTAGGYRVRSGSAIHVAMGCHSWGVAQPYAWYIESETHLLNCQGEGASVAEVMLGANDCVIKGGKYFGFAATDKGILVGDATHASPTGVYIDTKTANVPGGAIDFTYAGANGWLDLTNFQTAAGTVLVAASNVRASWFMRVQNAGSGTLAAGDGLNIPSSVTFRGASNAVSIVGTVQVVNVNASGKIVELPNATALRIYTDNFTTRAFEVTGAGHIFSGGATPTATVATAAGTGATVTISGTDTAGTVTLVTGTGPTTGTQVNVTFAAAYAATPKAVRFTPESGAAALLNPYTSGKSATVINLGLATAPAAGATLTFNYEVIA